VFKNSGNYYYPTHQKA